MVLYSHRRHAPARIAAIWLCPRIESYECTHAHIDLPPRNNWNKISRNRIVASGGFSGAGRGCEYRLFEITGTYSRCAISAKCGCPRFGFIYPHIGLRPLVIGWLEFSGHVRARACESRLACKRRESYSHRTSSAKCDRSTIHLRVDHDLYGGSLYQSRRFTCFVNFRRRFIRDNLTKACTIMKKDLK